MWGVAMVPEAMFVKLEPMTTALFGACFGWPLFLIHVVHSLSPLLSLFLLLPLPLPLHLSLSSNCDYYT